MLRIFSAIFLLYLALPTAAAERPLARFDAQPGISSSLESLLQKVLASGTSEASPDAEEDERRLRLIRENALEALSTEGYFSPRLSAKPDTSKKAKYVLHLDIGPQAIVADVSIRFKGDIEANTERVKELQSAWALTQGKPFLDADWSAAKSRLINQVRSRDYVAAQITESSADVDAAENRVHLMVEVDSGPSFTLGELKITGLTRYEPKLLERYVTFKPGDRYDATKLFDFQRQLQASQYFSTVFIDVDPEGPHDRAPVLVNVKEAKTRHLAFGPGFSTDTGARAQLSYRQALLFGYPLTLSSGVGIDRTRTVGFADFLLPPKPGGYRDSYGGLIERTNIQGVVTSRWAVAGTREYTNGNADKSRDTSLNLTYQSETRRISGSPDPAEVNNVLSATYTWTHRNVDKVTDPHRGDLLTLSTTLGAPATFENVLGTGFAQFYGRYVRYVPLSPRDQLIFRSEAGYVWSDSGSTVPNQFLFRTGGVGSVRGYAYQSLGVPVNNAVTGSRQMLVGSLEYVRWLNAEWGVASFFDAGNAGDDVRHDGLARGYGIGGRWKTLAGPLAFDIAYGERDRKWRFDFFFAIAF